MNFSKILLPLSILLIILVGCKNDYISSPTSNPTPKEYLKYDNADIFLLDGYVFSNAQDVEWVTKLEYELGKQVSEITKQAEKASKFENGTANRLPVGTKIFETDTPAYIAIVDGEEIPYLKMVEG
ncbi:hypothetical protein ACFFF5_07005 [Lederbergia wuyishanensis]|uniref:Uncharacterized protein n=1 Tax=Lederbergia wuyishanensis TaxID=1347903 RepID=A0ABU0D2J5_9BACI|nr:hypothetical protein [Lederbergia wuyishanensis]MCJ8007238.1 hypothetical protein [Lederbergia wuyishanensis]MDQ0342612.1 hypothetical protein [Lederbergia wuyishanensis]